MSSRGLPPKNRTLIGRPDSSANQRPVFWQEIASTHVLILISEKTDFSNHCLGTIYYISSYVVELNAITARNTVKLRGKLSSLSQGIEIQSSLTMCTLH